MRSDIAFSNLMLGYDKRLTPRQRRIVRRNPYGDYDRDGVINIADCNPTNPNVHGIIKTIGSTLKRAGVKIVSGVKSILPSKPKGGVEVTIAPKATITTPTSTITAERTSGGIVVTTTSRTSGASSTQIVRSEAEASQIAQAQVEAEKSVAPAPIPTPITKPTEQEKLRLGTLKEGKVITEAEAKGLTDKQLRAMGVTLVVGKKGIAKEPITGKVITAKDVPETSFAGLIRKWYLSKGIGKPLEEIQKGAVSLFGKKGKISEPIRDIFARGKEAETYKSILTSVPVPFQFQKEVKPKEEKGKAKIIQSLGKLTSFSILKPTKGGVEVTIAPKATITTPTSEFRIEKTDKGISVTIAKQQFMESRVGIVKKGYEKKDIFTKKFKTEEEAQKYIQERIRIEETSPKTDVNFTPFPETMPLPRPKEYIKKVIPLTSLSIVNIDESKIKGIFKGITQIPKSIFERATSKERWKKFKEKAPLPFTKTKLEKEAESLSKQTEEYNLMYGGKELEQKEYEISKILEKELSSRKEKLEKQIQEKAEKEKPKGLVTTFQSVISGAGAIYLVGKKVEKAPYKLLVGEKPKDIFKQPTLKEMKLVSGFAEITAPIAMGAFFTPAFGTGVTTKQMQKVLSEGKFKELEKHYSRASALRGKIEKELVMKKTYTSQIKVLQKYSKFAKTPEQKENFVRLVQEFYSKGFIKSPTKGVEVLSTFREPSGLRIADLSMPNLRVDAFGFRPFGTMPSAGTLTGILSSLGLLKKGKVTTKELEAVRLKQPVITTPKEEEKGKQRVIATTIQKGRIGERGAFAGALIQPQIEQQLESVISITTPRMRIPTPRLYSPKVTATTTFIIPFAYPKKERPTARRVSSYERELRRQMREYQASVGAVQLGIEIPKKKKKKYIMPDIFTGAELRPVISNGKNYAKAYSQKLNKLFA